MKTVYISNELYIWGNHSATYCILKLPAQRQVKGRREKGTPDKKENLIKASVAEEPRVCKRRSNPFNFTLTPPGQECETLNVTIASYSCEKLLHTVRHVHIQYCHPHTDQKEKEKKKKPTPSTEVIREHSSCILENAFIKSPAHCDN